jgi:membrane-bound serine protease (ClpP class)
MSRIPVFTPRLPCRPALALAVAIALSCAASAPALAKGPGASPAVPERIVDVVQVDGVISPVVLDQIHEAIRRSTSDRRLALVVEINTPGGLDTSMRSIVQEILKSEVPIITYVAPSGSRAASAGLFLVTASHVAAMAPNTNLGAASPVFMGGIADSTLSHKAMNDAAAFIETLAKERGRNAEWNVRAVREAIATSDRDAVTLHVVDFIAKDVPEVLAKASGRTVRLPAGERTLDLAGATIHRIEPSWRVRILGAIADPSIAYVLFNLGTLGLVFELSNPGAILPGVAGAICLVLALIAFQTLPINLGGLLLILIAMAFFIIELKVQSHGILAVGGVVAFVAGSLLLFDPGQGPAFHVSIGAIVSMTIGVAGFFLFAVGAGIRAQKKRAVTGSEGLRGMRGVALTAVAASAPGQVQVRGEIWRALPNDPAREIAAGQAVEIVRLEGLTARVKPAETP